MPSGPEVDSLLVYSLRLSLFSVCSSFKQLLFDPPCLLRVAYKLETITKVGQGADGTGRFPLCHVTYFVHWQVLSGTPVRSQGGAPDVSGINVYWHAQADINKLRYRWT